VIFVFARMPLTRLSKCFASSRSGAIDLALRLHSIAVGPVIDPHSPWRCNVCQLRSSTSASFRRPAWHPCLG
jgi:hypothetical protein